MNKNSIVKCIYFTILLLLPYAPAFLSRYLLPFSNTRWGLVGIPVGFGDVMLHLLVMSINFIVAFILYEIHKRKSIARITFLILLAYVIIFFIADASGFGEGMIIFFIPIMMIFPFNPLYFFGILIYDRYINPVQYISDIKLTGRTDRSITVEVKFPISGASGNELIVIEEERRFDGTDTATMDGTYTMTGLNPQTNYTVVMKWKEKGVDKNALISVCTYSLHNYIDAQGHTAEEIVQHAHSGGVLHEEDQSGLSSTDMDGQGAEDPSER